MKRIAAALSPQTEITVVLLTAFAVPVIYSSLILMKVTDLPASSDARLLIGLVFEVVVLVTLGALLSARGWTLERLGIGSLTLQDAIDGVGLLVAAYLIPAVILSVLPPDARQSISASVPTFALTGVSLALAIAASLLTPIFEEVFVVGYVFAALGGKNKALAMNVSVALRLAYHLYQGAAAAIFILPMAVVFAWWYSTRPSLWPLLIAHAALSIIGFAAQLV
jgi:membrane protease YdiL (CAAX protease family)